MRIRPIEPRDDAAVASVIRTVMPEFGADGPGFAIHDPEVDFMSRAYSMPRAAYFVVEDEHGRVVGGAGIAPLIGAPSDVCELRKMYFLPAARGQGIAEPLLRQCLRSASGFGFRQCYLETLTGMNAAQKLYRRVGFEPTTVMGATGHSGCNRFYVLALASADAG
jgi:putative acetyltransferase